MRSDNNCTGQHTSCYFSILLMVEINQWNQYAKMLTFVTWYMIESNTQHLQRSWGFIMCLIMICLIVICTPCKLKTFDSGVPDLVTYQYSFILFYVFTDSEKHYLMNLPLLSYRVQTLDWVFAAIFARVYTTNSRVSRYSSPLSCTRFFAQQSPEVETQS